MLANKKLVFIVGSARSGTNWLRRLLSQSPNVATGPETHLFSSYLRSLEDTWKRHKGTYVGLSHLITEDEFVEWMRGFAGLCLGRIAEGRPDARLVVEKTPKHGEYAADILRLFPDACFIHIIRDPRAVVPSLRAASRSWGSWLGARSPRRWQPQMAKERYECSSCRVVDGAVHGGPLRESPCRRRRRDRTAVRLDGRTGRPRGGRGLRRRLRLRQGSRRRGRGRHRQAVLPPGRGRFPGGGSSPAPTSPPSSG